MAGRGNVPLAAHLQGSVATAASVASVTMAEFLARVEAKGQSAKEKGGTGPAPSLQGDGLWLDVAHVTSLLQYTQLSADSKFAFLIDNMNKMQRESNENSGRLFGIEKKDAPNIPPREVLKRVLKDGVRLREEDANTFVSSALQSIKRVDRGRCIKFVCNRSDLMSVLWKSVGSLKNYVNPYNPANKVVISRNLTPLDNNERKLALVVKEALTAKGFTVKFRNDVSLNVNGGKFVHYKKYLVQSEGDAPDLSDDVSRPGTSGGAMSYAEVTGKRKADGSLPAEPPSKDHKSITPTGDTSQEDGTDN